MINELAQEQTSTLRFRREVTDRFGVLPNFFCSADAAPGLAEELWKFAKGGGDRGNGWQGESRLRR